MAVASGSERCAPCAVDGPDSPRAHAQGLARWRQRWEFLLPNGAWDNSWGTRNYKWSYWGSRTSDGCFPALMLLADLDPSFREAAWRNLYLMAACTHGQLRR